MTQLNIVQLWWNHSEQAGFKQTADGKAGSARLRQAPVSAAAQAMSYCLSAESEFLWISLGFGARDRVHGLAALFRWHNCPLTAPATQFTYLCEDTTHHRNTYRSGREHKSGAHTCTG